MLVAFLLPISIGTYKAREFWNICLVKMPIALSKNWTAKNSAADLFESLSMSLAVDLIITAAMIVVMIDPHEMTGTVGMIGIAGTSVPRTAENGLAPLLPDVPTTRNVVPGLHLPGGRLMIEGLQGTMITGEEALMIAEGLIIIAGTI